MLGLTAPQTQPCFIINVTGTHDWKHLYFLFLHEQTLVDSGKSTLTDSLIDNGNCYHLRRTY